MSLAQTPQPAALTHHPTLSPPELPTQQKTRPAAATPVPPSQRPRFPPRAAATAPPHCATREYSQATDTPARPRPLPPQTAKASNRSVRTLAAQNTRPAPEYPPSAHAVAAA